MKRLETPANFSINKARKAQICIAEKVVSKDLFPKDIKRVAGVDVAYHENLAFSAVVVLHYDTFEVLEAKTVTQKVSIPYVPTLLAFHELPPAIAVIRKLAAPPDVLLVDGHGQAHPFGCGLASHLGVALNKPTIGVAKSRLIGEPKQIGKDVFLVHKERIIGQVVTTRLGVKPVYVSTGHLVSLSTAVDLVRHFSLTSRIPEPIRRAHMLAASERKAQLLDHTSHANKA